MESNFSPPETPSPIPKQIKESKNWGASKMMCTQQDAMDEESLSPEEQTILEELFECIRYGEDEEQVVEYFRHVLKLDEVVGNLGYLLYVKSTKHTSGGSTPFHFAAALDKVNIVKLILRHAYWRWPVYNDHGSCPIVFAIKAGSRRTSTVILEYDAESKHPKIDILKPGLFNTSSIWEEGMRLRDKIGAEQSERSGEDLMVQIDDDMAFLLNAIFEHPSADQLDELAEDINTNGDDEESGNDLDLENN
eukprot:GHVH01004194.1.p1 GENE.GHVH01004194.1~~GHVH01004194.1.p1  ORF type:complete len:256 (+),score=36.86 GHVH01004194.1:22-768(+)